jgi:hypothetical protein
VGGEKSPIQDIIIFYSTFRVKGNFRRMRKRVAEPEFVGIPDRMCEKMTALDRGAGSSVSAASGVIPSGEDECAV